MAGQAWGGRPVTSASCSAPKAWGSTSVMVRMPCGRCRQLLWEHGGPDLLVDTPEGILPMTEVLPQAFGAEQLAEAAAPPPR